MDTTLIKMFNLINIGERAGSGIPNIYNVWKKQGWQEPEIAESFEPSRIVLTLPTAKKPLIKSADRKMTKKTRQQRDAVIEYILWQLDYSFRWHLPLTDATECIIF